MVTKNSTSDLRWKLKEEKKYPIQFIPIDKRIEYLIESVLGAADEPVEIDDILAAIYTSLKGTYLPENQEIMNVLEKISEPIKVGNRFRWKKRKHKIITLEQFVSEEIEEEEEIEIYWEHLRLVKQVAELGRSMGYDTWIGMTEQKKDKQLREWVTIKELKIPKISKRTLERVAEIDTIWFENGHLDKFIEVEARNYDKCILRIANIFEEDLPEDILPERVKIIFIIKDGSEKSFIKAMSEPSVKGLIKDKIKRSIFYISFSTFLKIKDEMDYSKLTQDDLIQECEKFQVTDLII